MGVDTKAILRKGTTLEEIKNRLELKYGETLVHTTHNKNYFELSFKEPKSIPNAATHRSLSVFFNDYAKNDYGIDGVLVFFSAWGSSIEIMNWLLEEFGGYLDENDCDDKGFYPVNIEAFQKGKEFTKQDLFVTKVIHTLGYENLNAAMELFNEFKEL